jgi:hypothetical protein
MWKRLLVLGLAVLVPVVIVAVSSPRLSIADSPAVLAMHPALGANARQMLDEGRRVFRYETFGDEAYLGTDAEAAPRDCGGEVRRKSDLASAQKWR